MAGIKGAEGGAENNRLTPLTESGKSDVGVAAEVAEQAEKPAVIDCGYTDV